MSDDRPPITSPLRRLARLGGLVGRVGGSIVSERVGELARPRSGREDRRTDNLVRNATRVVETLGELKGAAMKVGQMLSLHESLLPPEVAAVLRALQREAPRAPFEVMEYEIRGALPDYDDLFYSLEQRPSRPPASGRSTAGCCGTAGGSRSRSSTR